LRRVARHAAEAVTLLPVDLGLRQRLGNGAGISLTGARGDESCGDDPCQLRLCDSNRFAHSPAAFSSRKTLSTVTVLMRALHSTVTPAMCGVRIRFGTSRKIAAVLSSIGSVVNTSTAAPPR